MPREILKSIKWLKERVMMIGKKMRRSHEGEGEFINEVGRINPENIKVFAFGKTPKKEGRLPPGNPLW